MGARPGSEYIILKFVPGLKHACSWHRQCVFFSGVLRASVCSVVSMASFDLNTFLNKPSLEQLDSCKKDDLLMVASHFQIAVGKQSRKAEIRSVVYNRLVLDVLGLPAKDGAAVGSVEVSSASVGSENES